MARPGKRILPAVIAVALLLVGALDVAEARAGVHASWVGWAYREATGLLYRLGLDHAVSRWDPEMVHQLAVGQHRLERASLAAGVEAFLRGQYRLSQEGAAQALHSKDEVVAKRATRLADMAATWAQTMEPLALVKTGDELFVLRVPAGQEQWGERALPSIRQWVAAYRSLDAQAASKPLEIVFLPGVEELAALMQVESRLLERSGTVASTMFGHVLLLSPSAFPNGYFWPRVLCHELMHWLNHHLYAVPLPVVLEEGLAMWMEEWGLKGRTRLLSLQDRALLALAPSGLAAEMEQANQPFFQAESASSARLRFLLAWWRVRSEAGEQSPQKLLRRLGRAPLPRAAIRPSDLSELLAHARGGDGAQKQPLPREAASAVAYALYPDLLPERYAKTLDQTRQRLYLGDLLWGRGHRESALKLYLELPEAALMTPEVFWRVLKLRHELGASAQEYTHAEEVAALFPEDPRVLFGVVQWAGQIPAEGRLQEMAFLAWLTNPFARETQGMVKEERGH